MKVKVKLNDLCCANCAAKIQEKVSNLPGVDSVLVNFLTEKMLLEIQEGQLETLKPQIEKIVRKIEPDVTVEYL